MESIEDQLKEIQQLSAKIKRHHNRDDNTTLFYRQIIGVFNTELKRLNGIKHKHQDALDTPIERLWEIKLGGRTIFLLEDLHLKTIGDLLKYPKSDIQKRRNMGAITIGEISEFFKSLGIEWK